VASTWTRHRLPVRLTLDPAVRAEADRLAEAAHMSLSKYLEALVRAEVGRETKRARGKVKG
jgi:hypothetical protein